MRKNLTTIILVLAIILQLSVPVGMIAYSKNVEGSLLEKGKEFKVKVDVCNIYDGSIDYDVDGYYNWYNLGYYATIKADDNGYADLFADVNKSKPKTDDYIRVTMDNKEKLADFHIDSNMIAWKVKEKSAYILIKVYKGEFEILNLYIDDIPAEEWFETAIKGTDEFGSFVIKSEESESNNEEIQWD